MILLKLGGSIITNKQKPLTPNLLALNKIVLQLKKIDEPMVVVHGGGSFGHYWSVRYDMHTKPDEYSKKGVSVVKNAMVELNKIILDTFLKHGLNSYCLPPSDFMFKAKPCPKKVREIEKIAQAGFVPVSYGDVAWYGKNKFFILSGDRIMGILSKILKPRLAIFVLNVDGVYSDMRTKTLLKEINGQKAVISKVEMDVTGGMSRKIKESLVMSMKGTKVFFVNGNKPFRIVNAVKKGQFYGTLFRS